MVLMLIATITVGIALGDTLQGFGDALTLIGAGFYAAHKLPECPKPAVPCDHEILEWGAVSEMHWKMMRQKVMFAVVAVCLLLSCLALVQEELADAAVGALVLACVLFAYLAGQLGRANARPRAPLISMDELRRRFGENLKRLRSRPGVSQEELSFPAEIHRSESSFWRAVLDEA